MINPIIPDQSCIPLVQDIQPKPNNDINKPEINNTIDNNILNTNLHNLKKINTNTKINIIDNVNNVNNVTNVENINNVEMSINKISKIKVKNKNDNDKTSTDFLKELLTNQLKNINQTKRLNYNDIKRISKFLSSSIFDQTQCSLWNGYITNEKNQSKGTYINFYFNQKKIALHRLLYLNFIGDILNTEYLKFSCPNKGKCCNIHHLKKYSYNSLVPNNSINKPNLVDNSVHINTDKQSLCVEL